MPEFTSVKWIIYPVITLGLFGLRSVQSPQPATKTASVGVRCPSSFRAIWDDNAKVLRCRKDVVSWVVTGCQEKAFASYLVRPGSDICGPTEIAGVGTPPGARGSSGVVCAAPGYDLLTDRTGERDRCERIERIFALPLPAG